MAGRRKAYRDWLKCPLPKVPRSTAHRYRQLEGRDDNPPVEINNLQHQPPEETAQVIENSAQETEEFQALSSTYETNNFGIDSVGSSSVEEDERLGNSEDDAGMSTSPTSDYSNTNISDSETQPEREEPDQRRRDDLDSPIFPGVKTTEFECLLMCLHLMLRHGLTGVALQDVFKLINAIFGHVVISESLYTFEKLFQTQAWDISFHFYCAKCHSYIGKASDFPADAVILCNIDDCRTPCDVKKMNNGSFFITLPVGPQIKSFLESTPNNALNLLQYRKSRDSSKLSDVFDGKAYKFLSSEGQILSDYHNLSLTINTDGSPVYISTKNSLWPIQFRLNELPPRLRFEESNCMVAGIWFGTGHPYMVVFMRPFLNEARKLRSDGFKWQASNGEEVTSHVVVLNCVLDSVAKPVVQGVKQFNGYFGCGYCEHPGVMVEGHPHPRYIMDENAGLDLMQDLSAEYTVTRPQTEKHPLTVFNVQDRKTDEIRKDMMAVQPGQDIKGVNACSPLIVLSHFDLTFGFVIDYLHAVLLGVARLVAGLQLDPKHNGDPYYIGDKDDLINSRLKDIKPPLNMSRRPRKISERHLWHGNEWRAWLEFYSLPCLYGILPPQFFRHHCLLVTGIHILLKDQITFQELDEAAWFLLQYVLEFQRLYGPICMNFNVHLLLHIAKCVDIWGPLWSFSALTFEAGNGSLVKLVKGTRGVASQIARKYTMWRAMPKTVASRDVSSDVIDYCASLMEYRIAKSAENVNNVTLLGLPKIKPLSDEERAVMTSAGHHGDLSSCQERMIKDHIKYHSAIHYARQGEQSNDSIVKLSDDSFASIERIFVSNLSGLAKVYILAREINLERRTPFSHPAGASADHIRLSSVIVYGRLRVVSAMNIVKKAILVTCDDAAYVAEFPNLYEKD